MSQGVYIAISSSGALYAGSVAGGKSRSFKARWREHERLLELGKHPNTALQAAWSRDGGRGWRWLAVARVKRGDIRTARTIEGAVIKALGRAACNERGVR